MPTAIFNVRRPDGKLAAQSISEWHAEQEVRWHLASGALGPFVIERIEREPSSYWGIGLPSRSGGRWPSAKLAEFIERFSRGDPVKDIAFDFGTSVSIICKKARELGLASRINNPANFERHRGRWTSREEELINYMYDEATRIDLIAGTIPRTEKAITQRLRTTARTYSTRSRQGRFIVNPRAGHKGIYPVLEETSGPDVDSEEGGT